MDWADDDDGDNYFYHTGSDAGDGVTSNHCYDMDDNDTATTELPPEKPYTVLNETDIRQRQNEAISHVTSVLSVSKPEACLLLFYYKWNTSQLVDHWFANEKTVRNKVGLLLVKNLKSSKKKRTCGICFEEKLSKNQVMSTSCAKHYYCETCWRSYIQTSIDDSGSGCLSLSCPDPSCTAIVGQNMISELASKKHGQKYFNFFYRSYVEEKVSIKWCPAPGCDRAVELEHGETSEYDVTCDCSHSFCWNCVEEAHRPVECKVVKEWIAKNNSEAENTQWILAYTKPCPKCKRPIEKNHGCSHMTCGSPCRHQFCWLCLGDYKGHRSCNRYYTGKPDDKKKRKLARLSSERYTHYYERFASNNKSWRKAIKDLYNMQKFQLANLSDYVSEPMTELEFIVDSWKQIVECRRVLKWTYAYGYLLLENEDVKRNFFEYLQGEAELGLERLHHCAEIELSQKFYLGKEDGDDNRDDYEKKADFKEFRKKLILLTKVTGTYFENLVRALENGLSEVVSSQASSKGKGKGKGKGKKRKRVP